ncbi:MAG: RsmB/NOP family class I SAM-dependent RNA methyltransferase [Lachnospiraceae bacterium]|nr:RsmB/NOP family class I SAM-dependent RNA methyltransferase [Robinsoniella sp.]MDY3767677.1 RsmB/NOP family class I SAM-dependent RNA methyltransferase [Lachnospiraceae bacterium]
MKLPEAFLEKMRELLGTEYESYEKSYDNQRVCGLRVNTAKISVEEFLKITPFALRPIPWTKNGFYYREEDAVTKHPHYFAGLYYVQEPSAMIPARILPITPGEKVLDLCAAPGGKATELGAKLKRNGLLVANDISNSRAKGLLKNLELFGIGNMLVTSETPQKLLQYFPEFFDKILIDAPCSGEGMFRKDPSMAQDWLERGPSYYAPIQREILETASKMVKPGGSIVYSTCTFDPEENEKNIQYFLDHHSEFSIEKIEDWEEHFSCGRTQETKNEAMRQCVRIWPYKVEGEGHFAALLKRQTSENSRENTREMDGCDFKDLGRKDRKGDSVILSEETAAFFKQVKLPLLSQGTVTNYGGKLYLLPKDLNNIRGLRFLRTGLYLGEEAKNRFEPSQALAMYLRAEEYAQSFSMDSRDVRVLKYLKGETIEAEECPYKKGYVLVCVDGYPLGWAKVAGGFLKNKYYVGWRLQ